jgi:hypothetical protein
MRRELPKAALTSAPDRKADLIARWYKEIRAQAGIMPLVAWEKAQMPVQPASAEHRVVRHLLNVAAPVVEAAGSMAADTEDKEPLGSLLRYDGMSQLYNTKHPFEKRYITEDKVCSM